MRKQIKQQIVLLVFLLIFITNNAVLGDITTNNNNNNHNNDQIRVLKTTTASTKQTRAIDSIEFQKVFLADDFLKMEFTFIPGTTKPTQTITAFHVIITGNDTADMTITPLNFYDDNSADAYFVRNRTTLTAGEISLSISVIYTNATESAPLYTSSFNTQIHLLCLQETYAAFFSTDVYSLYINDEYPICNEDWRHYGTYETDEAKCAIYYELTSSLAVLAFRGTINTADIINDLENVVDIDCNRTWPQCRGEIGKGFYDSYSSVRTLYQQGLQSLQSEFGLTNLLITGHSKGAAEASLAVIDVVALNLFENLHISTFGLAAFGDDDFVDFWEETITNYGGNVNTNVVSTNQKHCDKTKKICDLVVDASDQIYDPVPEESLFLDYHPIPDTISAHYTLLDLDGDQIPDTGYYFVGADQSENSILIQYYLDEFPIIYTPSSVSLVLSPSKSRSPSPTHGINNRSSTFSASSSSSASSLRVILSSSLITLFLILLVVIC